MMHCYSEILFTFAKTNNNLKQYSNEEDFIYGFSVGSRDDAVGDCQFLFT